MSATQDEAVGPAGGTGGDVHDLVVVGGSAGGVEALRTLVEGLAADLPACVLVVLHLPRQGATSVLPAILARSSALPVRAAVDGDPLLPGTVLVAPPERHMVVCDGKVVLTSAAPENGFRPAIDVLFRSAAHDAGSKVVGVVLTGNLDDGSAGLLAVARHGGAALVQDPQDALFPGMPRNALASVPSASTAPLSALAEVVTRLVHSPPPPPPALEQHAAAVDAVEVAMALGESPGPYTADHPGVPSAWSCPDCSGVLWEIQDGPLLRFRCRTGHAWSVESLAERQDLEVETALGMALRALEERQALAVRVAETAEAAGRAWSGKHFRDRASEAARHAAVLRRLLHEEVDRPRSAPRDGSDPAAQAPRDGARDGTGAS
jgi:two-component system chemotaxis response regulator CheB